MFLALDSAMLPNFILILVSFTNRNPTVPGITLKNCRIVNHREFEKQLKSKGKELKIILKQLPCDEEINQQNGQKEI